MLVLNLLTGAAFVIITSTIMGFLGRLGWIFELCSHFRLQYFFSLSVFCLIFFLGEAHLLALTTSFFALLNLIVVLPLYMPTSTSTDKDKTYRVLVLNVLFDNPKRGKVISLIQQTDADLVALLELNQAWLDDLDSALREYEFSITEPREDDHYGIAFYSRYPFACADTHIFGTYKVPSLVGRVELSRGELTFVLTHAPPPRTPEGMADRNQQLKEVAAYARASKGAVMVLGDLNMTSWSPYFGHVFQESGLRDSRLGFGVQPTWPTTWPFLLVPLDHVLTTEDVIVHDRVIGSKVGSDHYPVILDFSLITTE